MPRHSLLYVPLAMAATLLAPASALLFGPLLLGVPHLLQELRVLTAPHRASRGTLLVVGTPLALLVAMRLAEFAGLPRPGASDVALGSLAIGLALLQSARHARERLAAPTVGVPILLFALADWQMTSLVLAHLHNLIAIVWLLRLARRASPAVMASSLRLAGLAGVGMIGVAVAGTRFSAGSNGFDGLLAARTGFDLELARAALAPALTTDWGTRLLLCYTFAQLLHYAIWIALIPRMVASSESGRSVRVVAQSFTQRALRRGGLALAIALVPFVALRTNPAEARDIYLALAGFHGWLELALLAAGWPASLSRRSATAPEAELPQAAKLSAAA